MQKYHSAPVYFWLYISLMALLVPIAGCTALATAVWIANPNDIDAEFDGLAKRRVAVVCRPGPGVALKHIDFSNALAAQVGRLLQEKVSKIDVVPQDKVQKWLDNNEFESYPEVGAAMDAELVVAIDLAEFRLQKGKTMLQARTTADLGVHEVATGHVLRQLEPIDSVYPPGNGIPVEISDYTRFENRFRRKYLDVVAYQIARRFFAHDSREDTKIDRFYKDI